ncbi:TnsA endonuclease N-terminal domain-containing protein [Trichlorobacter lovleyi]|uniref:TnsA endonuclease N-terminal domain-containing protein n=1 Tax=Trichlorobacter lovleyi TaxID=313985 RepID=UPI0023F06C9C|nr:TnsA endonuclease N-terminal domain-containing protein [Trichlorobacter lovleyi]
MNTNPESGVLQHGRSRKVVKRSNCGHPVKFASQKCGRSVHLESPLEYDLAIQLEFDPSVILFQEQPLALKIEYNGKIRTVYPDLAVCKDDGSTLIIEVKDAKKASQQEVIEKFELERQVLVSLGYDFVVMTDKEIRGTIQHKNSSKLLPYRRLVIGSILREKVLGALAWRPMSLGEMLQEVPGVTLDLLKACIAQSVITTDLTQIVTLQSIVQPLRRNSKLSENQMKIWERRCL